MKLLFDLKTRPPSAGTYLDVAEPATAWHRAPVQQETREHPDSRPSARRVVLIVEDDPWIQDITRELLEEEGFEIASATDGESGLKTAERLRPHLILLDISLPRMGGEELLERLRAAPLLRQIPVVAISGRPEVLSERIRGLANGALRKPFDVAELLDMVHAQTPPHGGHVPAAFSLEGCEGPGSHYPRVSPGWSESARPALQSKS